jgi:hypothetical protein
LLGGSEEGNEAEPPNEKTYEEMSSEEKLRYLNELLKKRPIPRIYQIHIVEDLNNEVCMAPQKTRKILNLVKKKEWNDLSISLFNAFNTGNMHWAMKIYYEHENNQSLIIPTMLFDALNALKVIKPPISRKEEYQGIVEDFSD